MPINVHMMRIAVIVLTIGLEACSMNNTQNASTAAVAAGSSATIKLSSEQVNVVTEGVKQIVANPQSVEISSTTAVALAGKPGIHVCGYLTHEAAGGRTPELPFYIEVRDEAGKPVAHRGQVGLDDAKRASVKFVCRHTGVQ